MRTQLKTLALAGVLLAPIAVMAQAPGGRGTPRGPGAPGAGPRGEMPPSAVTQILNARRALDLTPRQVAQLDSIERTLWAERAALRAQLESQRDSLRRGEGQQQARGARPQLQALRQRDSTARVAAERLLTDVQRGTLREMQAERRGYARGHRAGGRLGGRLGGHWRQGRHPSAPMRGARPPQRPE